jgi:hypothetical protein
MVSADPVRREPPDRRASARSAAPGGLYNASQYNSFGGGGGGGWLSAGGTNPLSNYSGGHAPGQGGVGFTIAGGGGGGSYLANAASHTIAVTGANAGDGYVDITAVPEPAAWSLMLSGFGFIGYMLRRRVTRPAARAA